MPGRPLPSLAVLAALVLSACGSGGDRTTTTAAPPTAASTVPEPATTATTPTTPTPDTRLRGDHTVLTGTDYALSLPGRGWFDLKPKDPASTARYDRIYGQPAPGGSQRTVETTRIAVSASEAADPDALRVALAGIRSTAAQTGGTVGRARRTTLDGEPALSVRITGRTGAGTAFAGETVFAVRGRHLYLLNVVAPVADASDLSRFVRLGRASWRWSSGG